MMSTNKMDAQHLDLKSKMDKLQTGAQIARNKWHIQACTPYATAYVKAFRRINDVLLKDIKDQQLKIDLAIAALSIAGGSLLTATFAQTVKTRMMDQALNYICDTNRNKTFSVYAFAATNPAAQFTLGKALAASKAYAIKALGDNLKSSTSYSHRLATTLEEPFLLNQFMKDHVIRSQTAVLDFIGLVREDIISDEDKLAGYESICNNQFFYAPTSSIYPHVGPCADRIALAFYLKLILDTDYLVTLSSSK